MEAWRRLMYILGLRSSNSRYLSRTSQERAGAMFMWQGQSNMLWRNWKTWVWVCRSARQLHKPEVSARVGSNGRIGCTAFQLLPGLGPRLEMDLWTWKSGYSDAGLLKVAVPCVGKGWPSSAIVSCVCIFEAIRPFNHGVWWHGAKLWASAAW